MYITVKEALSLPSMTEAVLLAGKEGLSKKIRSVNTMEVPDISRFLQAEGLLITTLYPIIDNHLRQQSLVQNLVDKKVSALLIVPLSVDKKIPQTILEQAEELTLPLIQLPVDTSFNKILNPILEAIFERKHIETEYRFRSSIIREILDGSSKSKSQILSLSKFHGWNLESHFTPVLMMFDFEEDNHNFYYQELMTIAEKNNMSGTIISESEDGMILLFPKTNILNQVKKTLNTYLSHYPDSTFGIGPLVTDIMNLPEALSKAKQAAIIAKKTGAFGYIIEFNQLGIYRILFDTLDKEDVEKSINNKKGFVQEKLGNIIAYDQANDAQLLVTLETFFAERENIKNTAKRLHIHYNTMRYRLNQIEKIANVSLDDPEVQLELKICLKIAALL